MSWIESVVRAEKVRKWFENWQEFHGNGKIWVKSDIEQILDQAKKHGFKCELTSAQYKICAKILSSFLKDHFDFLFFSYVLLCKLVNYCLLNE